MCLRSNTNSGALYLQRSSWSVSLHWTFLVSGKKKVARRQQCCSDASLFECWFMYTQRCLTIHSPDASGSSSPRPWPTPSLSARDGAVWAERAPFPGAQCVLTSPWRRLGVGGGRGLLRGGGFHLRHHQELRHLPSGPHDRVRGAQQSGPLDRLHLCFCHDLQWWVVDCEENRTEIKFNLKDCDSIQVSPGSAGPLSSVLTNRFGFQFVVMVGGSLISIGTIATSFTSSVNQMYLTYGLVAGNSSLLLSLSKLFLQASLQAPSV